MRRVHGNLKSDCDGIMGAGPGLVRDVEGNYGFGHSDNIAS